MFTRALLFVVFSLALIVPAHAATFMVNVNWDTFDNFPGNGICADAAGRCSLRAAIMEANSYPGADMVYVPATTYTLTIPEASGGGDLDVKSDMTIQGGETYTTIVQARPSQGVPFSRVFNVTSSGAAQFTVAINNMTIRNGLPISGQYADVGGGIYSDQFLTLNYCVVSNNELRHPSVNRGAGIEATYGSLTLNNTTVTSNRIVASSTTNAGEQLGAGIHGTASVTLNNSTVSNNQMTAMYSGSNRGAGIALDQSFTFNANNSLIMGNTSASPVNTYGAGIFARAYLPSTFNLTSTTVSGNWSSGGSLNYGGGVYLQTEPHPGFLGTGSMSPVFDKVTIANNTAGSQNAWGGGMFLWIKGGPINQTVKNSTVSGNSSAGAAGGVYIGNPGTASAAGGTMTWTNSTVSSNRCAFDGGGIYFDRKNPSAPYALNLHFVTIAGNLANNNTSGYPGAGGGIFSTTGGTVNLKNTVVANNSVLGSGTGHDIYGSATSQSYNHFGTLSYAAITNLNGTDTMGNPYLGPLANNSGPTQTHQPNFGPLIDAIPLGVNGCGTTVTLDQRGFGRPAHGRCDKGSVEWWYLT